MGIYSMYLIVGILYIILFIRAKGFFLSAGKYLLKKIPALRFYADDRKMRQVLLFIFVANLVGAGVTFLQENADTVSSGYLLRPESNETGTSYDLEAEIQEHSDSRTRSIHLDLDPRKRTEEEKALLLDTALDRLPDLVLDGQDKESVREDLNLVDSMEEEAIEVRWIVEDSSLIAGDGTLTDEIDSGGERVHLHAELLLLEDPTYTADFEMDVVLYPKVISREEAEEREILDAVEAQNQETTERVYLPKEVGGKRIRWFVKGIGKNGLLILFMGTLLGILMIYRGGEEKREKEKKKLELLRLDYPNIVSKLVLYLGAGMSARNALGRIEQEYVRQLEKKRKANHRSLYEFLFSGNEDHPGLEEIRICVSEMRHGVTERDAYIGIGKRCDLPEYKALSNILLQNSRKGGRELLQLLEREANEAMENRRKHARSLGEEAGTKLLMPMMIMLLLVMGILMVPAVLNFQL